MFDLVKSFIPTRENIGRILIGLLFIVTGIKILFGFSDFVTTIQGLNLPVIPPMALAIIAVGIKILAGVTLTINYQTNISRILLIIFVGIATFLMHNPIQDPNQLSNMMKNIAIIGGLLLIN